jgi:glycosyltransferase involved in cell wall biosynthesis
LTALDVIAGAAAEPQARGVRGASQRRPVYLNGKFYRLSNEGGAGAQGGVHRVADSLIRQLDILVSETGGAAAWDLRLLVPKRGNWAPEFSSIAKIDQPLGHTQFWEQGILPIRAAGGTLVNLANLSPILHPRKLTLIHDAQFRISPQSYARGFRWGYSLLTPYMARSSATVLTVSEYSRETLDAFGISTHSRTRIIYNGGDHILALPPDASVLRRLDVRPGAYAVLFGSRAEYKNIQVVLRAFDRPELADTRLVIIGPDEASLLAAGLAAPARTVFAGRVSDAALRALYEAASCLLFPSRTEGFGLPPLEAMLCGCPAVVAPAGALPEICRDAVLYADAFDPASWVDQILALRDPELRCLKVEAGRLRAVGFTWRAAGLDLLREIEFLRTSGGVSRRRSMPEHA